MEMVEKGEGFETRPLKEIIRQFFQNDWHDSERESLDKIKTDIVYELIGDAGIDVKNMDHMALILTSPDSKEAIYLRKRYEASYSHVGARPSELDYLDDIAGLRYLHSRIPGEGKDYNWFELDTDDYELQLKLDSDYQRFFKVLRLEFKNIDYTKFQRSIIGDVKAGIKDHHEFKTKMSFYEFTPEKVCEALGEKLPEHISWTITLDLGENVKGAIWNNGTLHLEATEYTEQLAKILGMFDFSVDLA